MSLRAVIEKELAGINDVPFHHLCNAVLAREHRVELHSPGTAVGKDKARTGHPDAFFPLRNGKYVLAEYTTQDGDRRAEFLAKLESDLQNCLNFEKLGIAPADVDRIVLCCNSKVSLSEREALKVHLKPYNLPLIVYGLDELGRCLSLEGKAIAKMYLHVPITGGYLLTRGEFVQQYQKGHSATPLDTRWVGRSGQVEAMAKTLEQKEIVVIKGPQGVGKTRLVLEAVDYFLCQHGEYEAFYVLNQAQSIEEDLAIHVQPGKRYLFFLDDVNQHPANLVSCINQLTCGACADLKIVATVRDYAKDSVINRIRTMNFEQLTVCRMDDDAITELALQVCHRLPTQMVLDRMLLISAGNPRLAIMATEALKTSHDLQVLQDAGSIYARYFDAVLRDNPILKQTLTSKAMGLIAFFYTIDTEDLQDQVILARFGFEPMAFLDTVRELEALEFVEIHDGCVVKIAEQTMATYFFYKVFLQDRSLPFSDILTGYFSSHWWQMRDGFVPAQEIFGTEKVLNPIREVLLEYYRSIRAIRETCDRFLQVFGRYFPNEVFRYLLEETDPIPEGSADSYVGRRIERGLGVYDHHPMVKLLEVQLESTDKGTIEGAIDVTFRVIRKMPHLYEAVVRKMRQALAVSSNDPSSIERFSAAFTWMEARRSNVAGVQPAFYAIFGRVLLSYQIDIGFFGHENGAPVAHTTIAQYRSQCWEALLQDFSDHRDLVFDQLIQYLDDEQYLHPILVKFDLPYLKRLIATALSPTDFGDCYFVNLYAIIAEEKAKAGAELSALCQPFATATWKLFLLYADEPFCRGRERVPVDQYEKAQLAREKKVISSVMDATAKGYRKIHAALENMFAFSYSSRFTLGWANDVILAEIAEKDPGEGFKAQRHYVKRGKMFSYFPTRLLRAFFSAGEPWVKKSYELIETSGFSDSFRWMETYFFLLPDRFINTGTIRQLINLYKTAPSGHKLFEGTLDKFLEIDPKVYQKIINVLCDRRVADEKFSFQLGYQFFQKLAGKAISLPVCKAAYLQQQRMPGHYDNDSTEFFSIFDRDKGFLEELVRCLVEESALRFKTDYRPLGKIWQYPKAEELLAPVFQYLLSREHNSRCGDIALTLFFGIDPSHDKRAGAFLQRMLRDYSDNDVLTNWVFEIARTYLKEQYMPLVLFTLRQNADLERFKRIGLLPSSFFTVSNEIWEEVRAAQLTHIRAEIANDLDRITYMDHLDYLTAWIDREQKTVKYTKRQRFRKFEH